jgi:hypothetical protein
LNDEGKKAADSTKATRRDVRWCDKSRELAETASEAGKRFNSADGGNYLAEDFICPTEIKCVMG